MKIIFSNEECLRDFVDQIEGHVLLRGSEQYFEGNLENLLLIRLSTMVGFKPQTNGLNATMVSLN
jgi:hypothetical protein